MQEFLKVARHLRKEAVIKNHVHDFSFLDRLYATRLKTSLIAFEHRYDNDLTSIFFVFIELMKIALNYEVIMYNLFINDVINKQDDLRRLFCFIGEMDAAISVSRLKKEKKHWCKPVFKQGKYLLIKDVVHPLVDDCVQNSLELNQKSLLLTGSNMSGKTTFIRTVALNVLLAQTLGISFASSYIAPFFKIFTSIRIKDNVEEHTSYYLEEVLAIKKLVDQVPKNERCIFVLDELFKGTNTLERVAASKSILTYLNSRHHIVLVSTHDIELTKLLRNSAYENYHFCERIVSDRLLFDYKLYKGILRNRNAIKILSLYGFPAAIVDDSLRTQEILMADGLG